MQTVQFETRLNWLELKRGIITSGEVKDLIRVATPPAFGGDGEEWSPEHLLISALSSSFMSTYLYYASQLGFDISHFVCKVKGVIALSEGRYVFSQIHLYPRIYVTDDACLGKAREALEKAKANCIVANSLKAAIIFNSEVARDPHPRPA
ncbi:OsmC family protein [Chitinophaga vietnamensis]|uniref:OsmC family protein n=1 Tax=Chitinophaga vietnamensis TaxID=2593957 RepID=UPI0011779DAE|nr:OsmC family protein [Chitinophaga vietnamensis]